MKHFTRTEDLANDEYLEIFRRAEIFEKGIRDGKNFIHHCPGKVIATEFFQKSTCTQASLQAAMTKLGGGWFGIAGIEGTYLESGEEDLDDTLHGVAPLCDIMAIRHKNFDLTAFAEKGFRVPLINAMCGGEEHATAAMGIVYGIKKHVGDLSKVMMGLYGMSKSSRPTKAYVKLLGRFGANFFEDPIIPEMQTPLHIQKAIMDDGLFFKQDRLENFIDKINVFLINEGLPQPDEDPQAVEKFMQKYVPIKMEHLDNLKNNAYILVGGPRLMPDGRLVVGKEIDNDPRSHAQEMFDNILYCEMALITYLLGIPVE